MQFLPGVLSVLMLVSSIEAARSPARSEAVRVRHVVDGETIDVSTLGRVRLLGLRVPFRASASDPAARAARARLSALVDHRWVRLEFDEANGMGRRTAYVFTEDGTFVNAKLILEGLACVRPGSVGRRVIELQRAGVDARAARRGMWAAAARRERSSSSMGDDACPEEPRARRRSARPFQPGPPTRRVLKPAAC